ncbi:universal stress protein [Kibdelosporangium philippinense]|uniref:Universal stress protein n=1 Tax=Kibdelosporangium philippinense TaxID=211113 RepID=A0ABS8ZFS6_9PSEU|nr:universal stress protein [Kibdelosporangium philippinense]MCE7004677.1 universal stress protein [Kibdelosporangium philippinense]
MTTLFEHHRPIIVGVDGSAAALAAVRWAAQEASARKLPLTLVHLQPDPISRYHDEKVAAAMRPALREQAEKWLHEALVAARAEVPDQNPSIELGDAEVVAALVEMSADAAMIVLGARGLGGFTGMLVGSTANSVVAGATCPVTLVRTPRLGPSETAGPVVVGVDGSPASEAAIKFAFEEASLRRTSLIAVHTWTEVYLDPELNVDRIALDTTVLEERERELLAQRLAGWQEKYPDVPVTRVVTKGRPVRALLDYDEQAQLIVVGSRGLGGYHGMLLGSTSQALMHYTLTPLAVVRP